MPVTLAPCPGSTYDASSKPPLFGHQLKKYFALDEDYVNLNHGSYGSPPLPVIFAATEMTCEIERNPDRFHRLKARPLLAQAREAVAKIIGAGTDEVVFAPNATHAANEILRNFEWREGDVVLGATTTYGAVANTLRYFADRSEQPRPTLCTIEYTFPLSHAEILDRFRAKLREVKQSQDNTQFTDVPPLSPNYLNDPAARKNKIVAVIDSITAMPGALMPWKEMVKICRDEGVWTVVDAAHSIGQEPNINLSEVKPDFWLSNCHKWLYAKRGCAVLYAAKRNQHLMKASIPSSWEYVSPHSAQYAEVGTNFIKQHEWTGALEQTLYLTVPAAIAFRQWLGGETAINAYCHQLALDGAKKLVEMMGTKDLDESGELTLNMPNIQLPLPVEKTKGEVYTPELLAKINGFLLAKLLENNTYASHYFHNGAWWCRCSTQVYNDLSDFEYLGNTFKAACKEIEETILPKNVA